MREGWSISNVNEVCLVTDYVANGSFKSLSENVSYSKEKDYAILLRTTDFTNNFNKPFVYVNKHAYDFLSKSSVYHNDIIICNVGSVGVTFLVPDFGMPATIGPNSILVRSYNEEIVNSKYVYYLFSGPVGQNLIDSITTGTTQLKFNKTNFRQLQIPIPPLPEQLRIVSILDEAFEAIDQAKANVERNIQNAEELFQSKLNEVFSQRGEGWEEKKLGDICEYDKTKKTRSDLPYVGMEDIESNTGRFLGEFEPREMKSSTFQFDSSHLLYGRLRPYLNKVLLPDFEGHCSTEIFPIKTTNEVKRKYLFYWFINGNTVNKIDATSTGARMPRANMKEVLNFSLPVPSIESQLKVIHQLDSLLNSKESICQNYQSYLNEIDELKKSILQKAFSGELTANEEVAA